MAGIQAELDLQGVGQHLQDHLSLANSSTLLSIISSTAACINITTLLGQLAPSFQSDVTNAARLSNRSALLSIGWTQSSFLGTKQYTTSLGHMKFLLSLTESQNVAIQIAFQRPFSQGSLYITTNNPFDYPQISFHTASGATFFSTDRTKTAAFGCSDRGVVSRNSCQRQAWD
ncbi:hypothetical protein EI94DRAFT_1727014, partial [Lactarius quietus]